MPLSFDKFTGAIKTLYIPALNQVPASEGLKILALAHTSIEGFFPGSKAYRTNNPGNIGTSALIGKVGTYPTLLDGVKAQMNMFTRILEGKSKYYKADSTLGQYIATYAPPVENDTSAYVNHVIKTFAKQGVTITKDTTLKQISVISLTPTAEKKKPNPVRKAASDFYNYFGFFITGK